jgi:uncharacterized protein YjbI with pentapeptide repeats
LEERQRGLDRRASGAAEAAESPRPDFVDAIAPIRHFGQPRLPDVGRGALGPELERYFRDHLEVATKESSRHPGGVLLFRRLLDGLERNQAGGQLGLYAPILVPGRYRRFCRWRKPNRSRTLDREGAGMIRLRSFLWMFLLLLTSPAQSADLTAEQVRGILAAASRDKPANLSGRSLENLDLSNFDFKGANLSGANLFGAKLDSAELSGANLSGARLDLAWIMRANFTNADLSKASLLGLVVSSGLEISLAEAPTFKGANFSGARLIARLSRFDLSGADFSKAKMGADMKNQSMGLMRTDLSGANLSGANFSNADLARSLMRFANLKGAILSGAILSGVDLSGADLTGADLTGADATEADLSAAILTNARGLDTMKGLEAAQLPLRR